MALLWCFKGDLLPDVCRAAAELKARIMSEYRYQLEVFNDSAEAQAGPP